jgi:hypothetical protein
MYKKSPDLVAQNRWQTWPFTWYAEPGISGRSPLQMRIAKDSSSDDQSLKGGSPLAI